jgi:hypothetical protein
MKGLWTVGVAAGLMAVMGCGRAQERVNEKIAEKMIEKQTGGKAQVDYSRDRVVVKTKEGEIVASAGGGATVPADFPGDVLVYKNAQLQMAFSNPDAWALTLVTKDSADKVSGAYQSAMAGQGWTQAGMVNMGGQIVLNFKKEKQDATIGITQADSGNQIVVSVTRSK